MRRLAHAFLCLLALTLSALPAAAQEFKTEDFTLTLPDEWAKTMENHPGNDVLILVYREQASNSIISVTVTPSTQTAEELCADFMKTMEGRGEYEISPTEKVGDTVRMSFTMPSRGLHARNYFTANGTRASVVVLLAPSPERLGELGPITKEALKPVDARLFPDQY